MASRLLSLLGQALAHVQPMAYRCLALMSDEDSSTFASWPTFTAGSAAPSEAQPNGSLYVRTSSGNWYLRVGGAWSLVTLSAIVSAAITAIGALTPAADKIAYFTGASAAALADFTAFGRSIVAAANAAAVRTLLGLETTANVVFAQVSAAFVGNLTGNADTATKLAAGSYYASVEQTGTGAEQIFAHGLVTTPSLYWVTITELPAGLAAGMDVAYGVMSATELRFTVTTGVKFCVHAIK